MPLAMQCMASHHRRHRPAFARLLAFAQASVQPPCAEGPRTMSVAKFVELHTNFGVILLELYTKHAPKACHNFYELAKRGYYNNTTFHRIVKDFVIQGGDPTGTGRGGQSIYGRPFEDECTPLLKHTGAGILSMANSGPNTNGSQFFITLSPQPLLDGKHTIFGRVAGGMEVVKRITLVPMGENDRPKDPVIIHRAVALD